MTYEVLFDPSQFKHLPQVEIDREWLKLRRLGIGASEVATLLGLNPYRTASEYRLWLEKIGEAPEPKPSTARQQMGHKMEATIVGLLVADEDFQRQYVSESWTVEPDQRLCQSIPNPLVLATPDYRVRSTSGLVIYVECKNTTDAEMWANGVPRHVYLQVQQQMHVLGVDCIIVAWLVNGWDFHWQVVERDAATIATIVAKIEEWWTKHVVGNVAPTPDGSDATKDAILGRYPRPVLEDVAALSGELVDLDSELVRVKQQLKDLDYRKDEIENRFRDAIGKHAHGVLPNGITYSWAVQERKAYTAKASVTRVLRRAEPKEGS